MTEEIAKILDVVEIGPSLGPEGRLIKVRGAVALVDKMLFLVPDDLVMLQAFDIVRSCPFAVRILSPGLHSLLVSIADMPCGGSGGWWTAYWKAVEVTGWLGKVSMNSKPAVIFGLNKDELVVTGLEAFHCDSGHYKPSVGEAEITHAWSARTERGLREFKELEEKGPTMTFKDAVERAATMGIVRSF